MKVINELTVIQLYFMFDNFDYHSIVSIVNQNDQILYEGLYRATEEYDECIVDYFGITESGIIEIVVK